MPTSIKDIARRAGVSHSTVSRALAGNPRIPEMTRQRILTLANELGYTPSLIARSLVKQETRTIGVVVASLTDPYAVEVVGGIEAAARASDYTVLIVSSDGEPAREIAAIQTLAGQRVDGVIVVSSRAGDRYVEFGGQWLFPMVLVNSTQRGTTMYSVASDNRHGASLAVTHLLHLGHRRIACIGGPGSAVSARERLAGYRLTLAQHKIKPDEALLVAGDGTPAAGERGLCQLIDLPANRRPSAIFCYNDLTAIGCLHAAHRRGVAVPAALSLVGFDNIPLSALTWPPLTTVDQRKQEMGRLATSIILDLRRGADVVADILMRGRLVERETCAHVSAT